jgi:hypothetical protein
LPDGRVLFVGGGLSPRVTDNPIGETTKTAVLYDPAGGPLRTGTAKVARESQTATLLTNGSVLIAGGQDNDYNPLSSAELYNP